MSDFLYFFLQFRFFCYSVYSSGVIGENLKLLNNKEYFTCFIDYHGEIQYQKFKKNKKIRK